MLILMPCPRPASSPRSEVPVGPVALTFLAPPKPLECSWLQVLESPTQVVLSRKGTYWLLLPAHPGVR